MTGSFISLLSHIVIVYTSTGALINGTDCNTSNGSGSAYGGYYIPGTSEINICINKKENIKRSIQHESGHYLYFMLMPKIERIRWEKLSKSTKVYVTDYASTSYLEDFAETFVSVLDKERVYPSDYSKKNYQDLLKKINFVKRVFNNYVK